MSKKPPLANPSDPSKKPASLPNPPPKGADPPVKAEEAKPAAKPQKPKPVEWTEEINHPLAGTPYYNRSFLLKPLGQRSLQAKFPVTRVNGVCDGGEALRIYYKRRKRRSSRYNITVTEIKD